MIQKTIGIIFFVLWVTVAYGGSPCSESFSPSPSSPPKIIIESIKTNDTKTFAEIMTERNLDPDIKDSQGDALIHIAVFYNRPLIIQQILGQFKGNIDIQDENGNTALHLAVQDNHDFLIGQLAFLGARVLKNNQGKTPQDIAHQTKNESAIKLFNNEFVSYISENTAKPKQRVSVVEDEPDQNGNYPLHSIVAYTLEAGYTQKALLAALALVLDHHYVNRQNADGISPLMLASQDKKLKKLAFLLKGAGGDSLAQDNLGYTPLHFAVLSNAKSIVHYFIQKALENRREEEHLRNIQTLEGDTPIALAIKNKAWGVALILTMNLTHISEKSMNIADSSGNTPLHLLLKIPPKNFMEAIWIKNLIHILLMEGANIHAKNQNGETPFDIVYKYRPTNKPWYNRIMFHNIQKTFTEMQESTKI